MRDEPVVQVTLLLGAGMQLVPDVRAAPGRAQPGQPELGAEPVGSAFNASSWPALCRVMTTEILNPAKPAAARLRIAASAVACDPVPRPRR